MLAMAMTQDVRGKMVQQGGFKALLALVLSEEAPQAVLKMAVLGGLQLATTAFSEGGTGLRAALHTPEEPPSHRACSPRLWCPL